MEELCRRRTEGTKEWTLTSSSLFALLRAFFFARTEELPEKGVLSGSPPMGVNSSLCLVADFFEAAEWVSLLWMREWRVSSSEREKRFSQPGKVQRKGFSPVCVRMCRVWRT